MGCCGAWDALACCPPARTSASTFPKVTTSSASSRFSWSAFNRMSRSPGGDKTEGQCVVR